MTDTTVTQSSPSEDGDDNNDRIEPLTGSLSASTSQQLLVKRLAELRAQKKSIADEEKEISLAVKGEMIAASAAVLTGENGVTIARLNMFDRTTVESKKLEALYPSIFAECSKTNQVIQVRLA